MKETIVNTLVMFLFTLFISGTIVASLEYCKYQIHQELKNVRSCNCNVVTPKPPKVGQVELRTFQWGQ